MRRGAKIAAAAIAVIGLGAGCRVKVPTTAEPATDSASELTVPASLPLAAKDAPPGWDRKELNAEMPYHWDVGPVRVLVWEVIDTDHDGRVLERTHPVKTLRLRSDDGGSVQAPTVVATVAA